MCLDIPNQFCTIAIGGVTASKRAFVVMVPGPKESSLPGRPRPIVVQSK
jgi:hypothetical protein